MVFLIFISGINAIYHLLLSSLGVFANITASASFVGELKVDSVERPSIEPHLEQDTLLPSIAPVAVPQEHRTRMYVVGTRYRLRQEVHEY